MQTVQMGDRVHVEYARIPSGPRANQRPSRSTCEFTVGSSEVFLTLSLGVLGMSPGERKQLTLQPAEAYGAVRSKLIRRVPRTRFPANLNLWVGKRLMSVRAVAGGRRRRVTVIAIGPETVILDGNHPLAGRIIELEVKLISIDSPASGNGSTPPLDTRDKG